MVVLLAVAALGDAIRERELRQAADRTRATLASGPPCFGAASRDPEQPCVNRQLRLMVVPTPLEAKETENAPCEIVGRGERLRVCRFGADGDEPPTVALIGDSHASAWRAPVDRVAEGRGLHGVSLTYTGCPFSTAVRDVPEPARGRCEQFRDEVFAWLEGQPQIRTVVTVALAGGSGVVADGGRSQEQAAADGYADAWRRLPDTVEQIVVIRDNPKAGKGTDECVQRAIDGKRPAGRGVRDPARRGPRPRSSGRGGVAGGRPARERRRPHRPLLRRRSLLPGHRRRAGAPRPGPHQSRVRRDARPGTGPGAASYTRVTCSPSAVSS